MKTFKISWQTADNSYGEVKTVEARSERAAKKQIEEKTKGTKILITKVVKK
jgi:hypothetical protein